MRKSLIITALLFTALISQAQTPVGTWSDHLNYNKAKSIAVGSKEVFASTGSSLMVYNKEFEQLRKLSRINGLTETGISTIGWSEDNETLIIAYLTTNIDLIRKNVIYNIPDISRKYIPGKKTINQIRTNGKYAYLACSFGIVLIDLVKNEIYDTWKPGNGTETAEVNDIAFGNGKVYAATNMGTFQRRYYQSRAGIFRELVAASYQCLHRKEIIHMSFSAETSFMPADQGNISQEIPYMP